MPRIQAALNGVSANRERLDEHSERINKLEKLTDRQYDQHHPA